MILQELVAHFNERFAYEHNSSLQPFILKNGQVSGIFGPIRISSIFLALRPANAVESLIGHAAQIMVSPYDQGEEKIPGVVPGNASSNQIDQQSDYQYIINLDRLSRTVHMLNYLQYSHQGGVLFLDVDPKHILGVQQNHGVYFEEVILRCGLATKQVVISMQVDHVVSSDHSQLLRGLNNYRQRGYQIALTIGNLSTNIGLMMDLIENMAPDYLRISAPDADTIKNSDIPWGEAISSLLAFQELHGGQSVIQQVESEEQAYIAAKGFNLVQGRYFDYLATDHLRCL